MVLTVAKFAAAAAVLLVVVSTAGAVVAGPGRPSAYFPAAVGCAGHGEAREGRERPSRSNVRQAPVHELIGGVDLVRVVDDDLLVRTARLGSKKGCGLSLNLNFELI